ncbi:hydrolase [Pseudomonas syringae]|uniref:Hydrolase n=1 Tax=Pseudomonas syringae TaxID=317 RepID=A0A1C7ZAS5_PSESX|nr:haloacid dehalogenase type II [Pseudomonas syringae]OCR26067.1 hydrolase [Pseudomonas syringae]
MPLTVTPRPEWLTFDCYGTLIQWDEGLIAAVRNILRDKQVGEVAPKQLIRLYDRHEHALEQTPPFRSFRELSGLSLGMAFDDLGLSCSAPDREYLTSGISRMPPFPEVVATLARLKAAGYKLCIVSNTDDDIIAGNVAQLGGHIDRVITAQQAGAYKPDRRLFDYAHRELGVTLDQVLHICASPQLDHPVARDMGFRCVWVDRGTGRQLLPDYQPDATVQTLDQIPSLLSSFVR